MKGTTDNEFIALTFLIRKPNNVKILKELT